MSSVIKPMLYTLCGAAVALAGTFAVSWFRKGGHDNPSAAMVTEVAEFDHGVRLLRTGQPGASITSFDRALARRRDWPEALYNRALARLQLSQPQEAEADLDAAIALRPDLQDGYFNRALARLALGDARGAVDDCDAAIGLRPNWPDARFNRAHARQLLGDFDGATADYLQALESASPDWPFRPRAIAAIETLRHSVPSRE